MTAITTPTIFLLPCEILEYIATFCTSSPPLLKCSMKTVHKNFRRLISFSRYPPNAMRAWRAYINQLETEWYYADTIFTAAWNLSNHLITN
jgi:hypothetical protein